jgi:hypothetical protein
MATQGVEDKIHRLDKQIGMLRFRMKHAGTGRTGAPKAALTAVRKKEMNDALKAMVAEREELRKKRPPTTKKKTPKKKQPPAKTAKAEPLDLRPHPFNGGRQAPPE